MLAALYESWAIPFGVLLGLPISVFGAFLGVWLRGLANDVYVQVGIVMLIGLNAKISIMIVEFAKNKRDLEGYSAFDAAVEGARLRFRAVLMTALAEVFGFMTLVLSTGAGAAARRSVGTAVVFGMATATLLSVFFIPVLYYAVETLQAKLRRPGHSAARSSRNLSARAAAREGGTHETTGLAPDRRPAPEQLPAGPEIRTRSRGGAPGISLPVSFRASPSRSSPAWRTCPGGRFSTIRRFRV